MNIVSTTGLIVFCALLGSVFSCWCKYCDEKNGKTCSKEMKVQCAGDQCMTISQCLQMGENEICSIYKDCANTSMCQTGILVTYPNTYLQNYVNCCSGNLCNNDTFNAPNQNKTLNGYMCPYCYETGTMEECTPEKNIECLGAADMCLDYRGIMRVPGGVEQEYAKKICANNVTCGLKVKGFIGIDEIQRENLSCQKATRASPQY